MRVVGEGASITVSVASLGVMGMVAYVLHVGGLPGEVVAPLASGVAALLPTLLVGVQERRKSRADRLREIICGQVSRPPYLTALITALLMVLAIGVVMILVSLAAALTMVVAGYPLMPEEVAAVTDRLYWLMVVPLLVPAAVLIGRYAGRRLGRGRWPWLVGSTALAVALLRLTSLGLGQFSAAPVATTAPLVPLPIPSALRDALLLLLPALIGWRWGLRSQEAFLVQRLVRRLEPDDRRAVLELLGGEMTPARTAAAS